MGQKLTDGKISAECRERLRTIHDTQDILGGKWKVMIIASLAAFGKKRFMELQRVIDGVGSKMLSRELQELEVNGLVSRTVMATKPLTVEYELTDYGRTLKPIIDEMATWGKQHRQQVIRAIKDRGKGGLSIDEVSIKSGPELRR